MSTYYAPVAEGIWLDIPSIVAELLLSAISLTAFPSSYHCKFGDNQWDTTVDTKHLEILLIKRAILNMWFAHIVKGLHFIEITWNSDSTMQYNKAGYG